MKKLLTIAIVISTTILPLHTLNAAFVIAPPPLEQFDAKSVLLVDEETGSTLVERAIDRVYPIASLTKLMTAEVFLATDPDWQARVRIEPQDHSQDTIVLVGETYSIRALFEAALIGSSNTAVNALVRSTGVDRWAFVQAMNERAQSWGMTATHFVEPTGLDAQNVSTARDVAQLVRITMGEPTIRSILNRPSMTLEGASTKGKRFKRVITNTNWLLRKGKKKSPYVIVGGKTGHSEEAGYNLAVLATSSNRRTVLAIVLGTKNHFARFEEVDRLLQWASKALKPLSRMV